MLDITGCKLITPQTVFAIAQGNPHLSIIRASEGIGCAAPPRAPAQGDAPPDFLNLPAPVSGPPAEPTTCRNPTPETPPPSPRRSWTSSLVHQVVRLLPELESLTTDLSCIKIDDYVRLPPSLISLTPQPSLVPERPPKKAATWVPTGPRTPQNRSSRRCSTIRW